MTRQPRQPDDAAAKAADDAAPKSPEDKAAAAKAPDDAAAKAAEAPRAKPAAPGKAGQANVLLPVTKVPVPPKPPAADRDTKQGVVGGPPTGAAVNAQYLKPTVDKAGVDKRQGLAAKAKLPEKPGESPKPVVEEVVEKPKVKLRQGRPSRGAAGNPGGHGQKVHRSAHQRDRQYP